LLRRRVSSLAGVQQVGWSFTLQVGHSADRTTNAEARSERVDQPVDGFRRGQVLARYTQQQSFLTSFRGTFSRTTDNTTDCATAQQLSTTTTQRSTRSHSPWSTHTAEDTTGQQVFR
jgi:hypothetical protein